MESLEDCTYNREPELAHYQLNNYVEFFDHFSVQPPAKFLDHDDLDYYPITQGDSSSEGATIHLDGTVHSRKASYFLARSFFKSHSQDSTTNSATSSSATTSNSDSHQTKPCATTSNSDQTKPCAQQDANTIFHQVSESAELIEIMIHQCVCDPTDVNIGVLLKIADMTGNIIVKI